MPAGMRWRLAHPHVRAGFRGKGATFQVAHPRKTTIPGVPHDIRRDRQLRSLQIYRLRGSLPRRLLRYEGENFLVIHPDECIDCGVCEPECPAEAIKPDTEPGLDKWLKINADYASIWPNITVKRDPLPEAKEMDGEEGKFEKYFSANPGSG